MQDPFDSIGQTRVLLLLRGVERPVGIARISPRSAGHRQSAEHVRKSTACIHRNQERGIAESAGVLKRETLLHLLLKSLVEQLPRGAAGAQGKWFRAGCWDTSATGWYQRHFIAFAPPQFAQDWQDWFLARHE